MVVAQRGGESAVRATPRARPCVLRFAARGGLQGKTCPRAGAPEKPCTISALSKSYAVFKYLAKESRR